MTARLFTLSYSPWSEKARWALDHHAVPYREVPYFPIFGVPALRLRTRRLRGHVTIPVLVDGSTRLGDSHDIARHAERVGHGPPLFPPAHDPAIRAWVARSEALAAAGRALAVGRVAQDPEAQRESLPSQVPDALRDTLRPIATLGIRYLTHKYALDLAAIAAHEAAMRDVLHALRQALGGREEGPLLGPFTFADVAMAATLQFVRPLDGPYMVLGPASRLAWTRTTLAAEFPDVLAWRDAVYAAHRAPAPGPVPT